MATDLFDYFDSVEEYEHYLQIVQSPNWQTELLLTRELQDSIKYDDPSVFKRLRIDEEDEATVERCHERYQAEQAENIDTLLRVVATAEEELRAVDRDFFDEVALRAIRRRLERVDFQKYMCEQLQRILTFLTDSGDDTSRALREFQRAVDLPSSWPPVRAAGACTPGNTNICPDFTLTDRNEDRPIWGCCAGFAKVKVFMDEDIVPANDSTPTAAPAILECADYARYHMSLRPFWNFSITLLISGTVFRVMIADRSGVIFSPARSIVDDAATTFVRVVRALTRHLTEYQLGQDPSVVPLSRGDLRLCLQLSSRPEYYPSYRISHIGDDARQWCTVGPPIWTSLSLVGRGTVVWKVLELTESGRGFALKGDFHLLRSYWRNPLSLSETEVYALIDQLEGCPRGIPRLLCGGDVCCHDADPQTWSKVTVARIRGEIECPRVHPSKTLHRTVIPRVAEPLWKYRDELELLCAVYSIVEAHQYICEHGILHGNVNPGTMLLWRDEPAIPAGSNDWPIRGFLADFGMAEIDGSMLGISDACMQAANGISSRPIDSVPAMDALQFTALELLRAVNAEWLIPHTAAHDLESIAYVLGHTVWQHLVDTPGCPVSLKEGLQTCFGETTVQGIIAQRTNIQPLYWVYMHDTDKQSLLFTAEHVSMALADVLNGLGEELEKVKTANKKKRHHEALVAMYGDSNMDDELPHQDTFPHKTFLNILKKGISTLEHHPEMMKGSSK
ncbi:uncharacterized protein C8Q71DRAFT_811652 [Rhodofomes roseus]|uniref:Fungal-type protein kinase domain-containing protein n=1 Tax=Rhodofomes roseus TaxID=34475 RepID=A0ABQ8KCM5_9APHY|nr:uncharacterized protein C8Q71DRAFT_811652 [Rhodofomes roseus]KAH9835117.1 hypothetical protein C8Q71DRAFT_811652 [Rhodofomes roseus]